jgi:hypothetical protein
MPDDEAKPDATQPPPEDPKLEAYKDGVRKLDWFITPVSIYKEEELEAMFEPYPLTPPSEDQRWVLWTVWIWIGFTALSTCFILWLIISGFFYSGH